MKLRILTTKYFEKWAKTHQITDKQLIKTIAEIESGLHDGDLGGHLLKKRVARVGQGKSGGYRTIIAIMYGEKAFFLYGYAKQAKANISQKEKIAYKALAEELLVLTTKQIDKAIKTGHLIEVTNDERI